MPRTFAAYPCHYGQWMGGGAGCLGGFVPLFFAEYISFWCVSPGFARWYSPISTGGMYWVVLERNTPILSYMPLLFCAVCSLPPWQALVFAKNNRLPFFLRQLSVRPPTHPPVGIPARMGGGGGVASAGVLCACAWFLSLTRAQRVVGSRGFRKPRRQKRTPPPPYQGKQDCVVVWLPTPPPTEGQGL